MLKMGQNSETEGLLQKQGNSISTFPKQNQNVLFQF